MYHEMFIMSFELLLMDFALSVGYQLLQLLTTTFQKPDIPYFQSTLKTLSLLAIHAIKEKGQAFINLKKANLYIPIFHPATFIEPIGLKLMF